MRAELKVVSPAKSDAKLPGTEAAGRVAQLEKLAAEVKAGKLTQPQLEGAMQGMKELSREASETLWAWAGGGPPGAIAEGAALRERMTAALATLAEKMPDAVVYTYGPEFADKIKNGELDPTISMRCNYLQTAMLTAQVKGDLATAKGFAEQLVKEFPKTAGGFSAAALLAEGVRGKVSQQAATGWEGRIAAAAAAPTTALVSVANDRPADVSKMVDAWAGIASDAKMGYATKEQVEARLGAISTSSAGSDWLWSKAGEDSRKQLLASMQVIASKFPDAVMTRYPPEVLEQWKAAGNNFDPTITAQVGVLQFQMNDALARGDGAALKRYAGQLLETAPNSALSPWAKSVLAE